MGWCAEFGPQIQHDCGQAMVAGEDSCSCPSCRVVCRGRFQGCAGVWARGPQPVTLARSKTQADSPDPASLHMAGPNGAVNGNGPTGPHRPLALGRGAPDPDMPRAAAMAALANEIKALSRRLDETTTAANGARPEFHLAAGQLMAEFETLPERIAHAVGAALVEHRQLVMNDVRASLQEAIYIIAENTGPRAATRRPAAAKRAVPPAAANRATPPPV